MRFYLMKTIAVIVAIIAPTVFANAALGMARGPKDTATHRYASPEVLETSNVILEEVEFLDDGTPRYHFKVTGPIEASEPTQGYFEDFFGIEQGYEITSFIGEEEMSTLSNSVCKDADGQQVSIERRFECDYYIALDDEDLVRSSFSFIRKGMHIYEAGTNDGMSPYCSECEEEIKWHSPEFTFSKCTLANNSPLQCKPVTAMCDDEWSFGNYECFKRFEEQEEYDTTKEMLDDIKTKLYVIGAKINSSGSKYTLIYHIEGPGHPGEELNYTLLFKKGDGKFSSNLQGLKLTECSADGQGFDCEFEMDYDSSDHAFHWVKVVGYDVDKEKLWYSVDVSVVNCEFSNGIDIQKVPPELKNICKGQQESMSLAPLNVSMVADTPPDSDNDGIWDSEDKCPAYNDPGSDPENNDDVDSDGVGDVCDNCPNDINPGQGDSDSDGIGDKCDVCPLDADPNQDDSDGDGVGNVCDVCPDIENSDQLDFDHDGLGDVCDDDDDADGILDEVDNCLKKMNADQADVDGNGIGDACDSSSYVPLESSGSQESPLEEAPSLLPPHIIGSGGSEFSEGGCTLIPGARAIDHMTIFIVGLTLILLIIRRSVNQEEL